MEIKYELSNDGRKSLTPCPFKIRTMGDNEVRRLGTFSCGYCLYCVAVDQINKITYCSHPSGINIVQPKENKTEDK